MGRKGAAAKKDKNLKAEESEKRGGTTVENHHGDKDKTKTKTKKETKKPENLMDRDREGGAAKEDKNVKAAEKIEKLIVFSLAEVAAKMDLSDLKEFLDYGRRLPDMDVLRFYFYFEKAFAQVSFPWVKLFKETPLSERIDFPLSQIPTPLYQLSVDWIKQAPIELLSHIVLFLCDRILDHLAQGGDNVRASYRPRSQAGHFVVLAMVLRCRPDSLIAVLPSLRDKDTYQGPDKLPLIVWMMAQASVGDLSAGLYSWMCNLLPLVSNDKCCPQSSDLVLQLAEFILSRPDALTILVKGGGVMEGQRLVPLPSLKILLRLTFPAPSARVEEITKRFEAIYPSLKEVALSPERAGGGRFAMKNLFAFALTLTGEKGNPSVLTKEATSIAIRSLTENIDCFEHWDRLYMYYPEASVALLKKLLLLKKLVDASPSDTLTVNKIIESFRRKNKRAIAKGGANCSLYKEADKYCTLISKYCTLISWRLFGRPTLVTAGVVTAASAAASFAAVAAAIYSL
ncbi:hypothetical protein Rs2_39854 [Raphanus sativus]|uniref:Uncharacterized protein LOC108825461 n=1 Tax=Raphanus sativus TaxID=3726 RepID=A0A6J0L300_RAPSA|nr:uncharacterized protein LOC108825461 [Raphanus sativus]XP_056850207.1 uncharacterized protein LOC130499805 [Raphanus sativus]XP_056851194.1 uncharacterized protein LOC130500311 [Raphanus sativus]KAJ4870621.1 hypothetical protein Rs2_47773 [Raphanus sativus]KAJ4874825.1 hypothetical protein Rs2_39843 [Raphanus sativus]KAJ4874836.1 hypothetical protein Rs2_39854 [Raphanus sativus]